MMTLTRAARQRPEGGRRLPDVWASWQRAGLHLRRGLLALMVAAPGIGKSTVAHNYCIWAGQRNVDFRGLYLSMDTDPDTVCERVIAAATHSDLRVAERGYEGREQWAMDALASVSNWMTYAF